MPLATPTWYNHVQMIGLVLVYCLIYILVKWMSIKDGKDRTWLDYPKLALAATLGFVLPVIYMGRLFSPYLGTDNYGVIPALIWIGAIGLLISLSRQKRTLAAICLGMLVIDVWWWR